mmetsp:Transcript_40836/g.96980  ORF Transcript_40836/g.96980 Transcript_40836/m.96980 type:complete len:424 (-) Transcript_40836:193-1464(-)
MTTGLELSHGLRDLGAAAGERRHELHRVRALGWLLYRDDELVGAADERDAHCPCRPVPAAPALGVKHFAVRLSLLVPLPPRPQILRTRPFLLRRLLEHAQLVRVLLNVLGETLLEERQELSLLAEVAVKDSLSHSQLVAQLLHLGLHCAHFFLDLVELQPGLGDLRVLWHLLLLCRRLLHLLGSLGLGLSSADVVLGRSHRYLLLSGLLLLRLCLLAVLGHLPCLLRRLEVLPRLLARLLQLLRRHLVLRILHGRLCFEALPLLLLLVLLCLLRCVRRAHLLLQLLLPRLLEIDFRLLLRYLSYELLVSGFHPRAITLRCIHIVRHLQQPLFVQFNLLDELPSALGSLLVAAVRARRHPRELIAAVTAVAETVVDARGVEELGVVAFVFAPELAVGACRGARLVAPIIAVAVVIIHSARRNRL